MVIGLVGESCVGKSTLAEKLSKVIGAEIVSGKDYLRMAKSESEAVALFKEKLQKALKGDNVIYIISEKDQLELLPEGAVRVLVTADLDTIKERFKNRMHGVLPKPVEEMLERKHGMFDNCGCELRFDSSKDDPDVFCKEVAGKI